MIHFLKISQNKIKYFSLARNFRNFFSTAKNQILQNRIFKVFFTVFFRGSIFVSLTDRHGFLYKIQNILIFFSILKV